MVNKDMKELKQQIVNGALAKSGIFDKKTISLAAALLQRLNDNNIETVRVVFADQNGILRGKTIVADALISIFTDGLSVPATLLLKDTSHRTVFPIWTSTPGVNGFEPGAGDILMLPDPETFRILPWSPHTAWIFCNPRFKSGETISFSPRDLLKSAIEKLAEQGLELIVGLEIEFHIFERVDPMLEHAHATMPSQAVKTRNLTHGYQFLTDTHYDAVEPIMDELRRNCIAMNLPVRSMEIEMGPSQFEFTFGPADPLTHADNVIMFRTMVKEVCARQGLHATFMCQPNVPNAAASGWHLHQSLVDKKTGRNLMIPKEVGELSPEASSWIAGLLAHAAESCLLTTPTVNGYKRYKPNQLAPDRILWGRDNRGAMIRGLMSPENPASRIENRVAETTANPYFFFASQILSGLDGLISNLSAPEPVETPYSFDAQKLPDSLLSAIDIFEASRLYRTTLGHEFVDYITTLKRSEWDRYHREVSEWEQNEYFGLF